MTPGIIPFPIEKDSDLESDEHKEIDELTKDENIDELTEDENNVQIVMPCTLHTVQDTVILIINAAERVSGGACHAPEGQGVDDALEVSDGDVAAIVNILETIGELS